MKAKALQLATRLRARGLTASAAAKLVGIVSFRDACVAAG
jgi:hypothetical protein